MPRSIEHPTFSYNQRQAERIQATEERIGRRSAISVGRVIPDAEDLAIHDGRHLEATVLFLDISGFTGRPQESAQQQEELLRCLSLYFTEMIHIIEDFGGVVEKNTGDGLMAYFSSSPEDNYSVQQRAVSCALTMFDTSETVIAPAIRARGQEPFQFRVCIDHGAMTIAKMGAARRFNGIVAIGTPANLACKMLQVAKAGDLMIGDKVASELEPAWKQYLRESNHQTGYYYLTSGLAYKYWYYGGRWVP